MVEHWRIDANVLIRYLTNDQPGMAASARVLIERAAHGDLVLRVVGLVVAEVVWVLGSVYRWSREDIKTRLSALLISDGLEVESLELVLESLRTMSASNVAYTDAFLAESARGVDEPVVSFDRNFARLNVRWIEPD